MMNGKFEIERGIPIPTRRGTRGELFEKMPLEQMEVGDSFYAPANGKTIPQIRGSVCSIIMQYRRKNDSHRF
jgi:hypothetical protein